MLATDRVRMRPPAPDDATNMHRLFSDPEWHLVAAGGPFVPSHVGQVRAKLDGQVASPPDGQTVVSLLAEASADGAFLGSGVLWGIDTFHQYAHLGVSLLPEARGQGYGTEVVGLLCRYGFRYRNLRRLEMETFASNEAMRRTAERCGFVCEGILREREYSGDGFTDIAVYGLLRPEWTP